jgi:hypothetical protein
MDLDASTAHAYLVGAFDQMLAVAAHLGDDRVNVRPPGPDTNTVAALIVHCCGVTGFWLGHVALGRPSDRDRDAELRATATVAELHERVAATLGQAEADLAAIDRGEARPGHPARAELLAGIGSDVAVVLHVLEEVYQHLGQMELTADALTA